jgi:hypothetical protein
MLWVTMLRKGEVGMAFKGKGPAAFTSVIVNAALENSNVN